jgi:hypothetical protein
VSFKKILLISEDNKHLINDVHKESLQLKLYFFG